MDFANEILRFISNINWIEVATSSVVVGLLMAWLNHRQRRQIEQLKSELRRVEMQFSELHKRRADVIAELYEKLVLAHKSFEALAAKWSGGDTTNREELEEVKRLAEERGEDFDIYFEPHRIYLDEELCIKIENLSKEFSTIWFEHITLQVPTINQEHKLQSWLRNWKRISEKVPEIRREIEAEFRQFFSIDGEQ